MSVRSRVVSLRRPTGDAEAQIGDKERSPSHLKSPHVCGQLLRRLPQVALADDVVAVEDGAGLVAAHGRHLT